jgi:cellulose biosynthesis protein BcsQ
VNALDLRRRIPPHVWLANRARNALGRPAFIIAISIGTFVTAAASIAIGAATRDEVMITAAPRPDTLTLLAAEATGRMRIAEADSAIGVARARADSLRQLPPTALIDQARRDSLVNRVQLLEQLMARADQAPLPPQYRALAAAAELRADPRVQPLVDTLTQIEQDREALSSAGGVDPVFVALTTRVNELGRALQAIAVERRNLMLADLTALGPPQPAPAEIPDTARLVMVRDSARAAMQGVSAELTKRREAARALDREEARARERATAVAPTHAMLGAAFAFSAVIGFAVALVGELRKPRVSNAAELERYVGVHVISSVPTLVKSADRGRREADRSAPPYFNPSAEGYQLAYLALATDHPTLLMATVTGDDPAIVAVIGCNLAAIAADEARNTLVIDLDPARTASAALRARAEPGITDIILRDTPWPAATTAARAGRDRLVDLVPYGSASPIDYAAIHALLSRDATRLARYYDSVILIAPPDNIAAGLASSLPSPEFLYCVQPGSTPLHQLREQLDAARAAGAVVRGIVIWDAERPDLAMAPAKRPPIRPPAREAQPSTV